MVDRVPDPRRAMDYPALSDGLWIIWTGNQFKWPDGRRNVMYMTRHKRDVMKGFALFTDRDQSAATFETEEAARAFLADEQAKRPSPYNVNVSTVATMKQMRGYEKMTEHEPSNIATYSDHEGKPVPLTYFADVNSALIAFSDWDEREKALGAAKERGGHAEAVTHHDAFQFARMGRAMWLRGPSGDCMPLHLNASSMGVRAI